MAAMKLLGISVGGPREITYQDRRGREKTTTTSIFKDPVEGRALCIEAMSPGWRDSFGDRLRKASEG